MSTDHTKDNAPPVATLTALKALPRPVWILFAGTFLNKFGTFVIPFLTLYLTRRGFSVADAGLAIGAYGVGQLLASISGGHLADTLGRRKTIVFSMFSVAAAMLLLSQAQSLTAIILLTGLVGWTGEFYRPASGALLADLVPANQRVTAYSAHRLAFNAGWAFGPATAGFLATSSFLWLFIGDALTSVLFGIVAWTMLPRGTSNKAKEAGWREAIAVMKRDRRLLQVMLANLLIGLLFQQLNSTYSLHVSALGFSDKIYGALLSFNGVLIVLCELPLTSFTQRFPPRRMMALGYALIGTGFAANAFAHGVPALAAAMALFTLGEMVQAPVTTAYVASLAPAHLRGRYMGSLGLSWALAIIIGPAVGMTLFQRSPGWFWMLCGVLGAMAAGVILAEPKRAKQTLLPAPGELTP